jgi:hypothetical protein
MTTDLRGLNLADLTRSTGLEIRVRRGDTEVSYAMGITTTGGTADDLPIDEDSVLAVADAVHISTRAPGDFELDDPELLRKLAPIIPAVRAWVRSEVHRGSPAAQVLIGLNPDGYIPGPNFAHGSQHPAVHVKRIPLNAFGVDTTVSVAVCPIPGCKIVHVGL